MSVEAELALFTPEKDTLLTIGVFDGVHLGHKHLIAEMARQAKEQSLLPGVVTFRQHPQDVLPPRHKISFLTRLDERIRLLKEAGAAFVVTLSFTKELSRLSAREFLALMQKYLRMRGVVIGPDFALGREREGDVNKIRALGEEMSFSVTAVPALVINSEIVSSTTIRDALAQGDMQKVARMTGRSFNLSGVVVAGAGRGKKLGFPTANLDINSSQAVPADGVYASAAYINGRTYPSLTYIGKVPTFGGGMRVVEVYVFDYEKTLYGREVKVDVVERLRGEMKFQSAEELKQQMAEDVKQGKALLQTRGVER